MPLFKRKPFPLVEPPPDLEPHELVFQVRFTKEIFRDYQDYLNRINLYRQRVWMCKVTGKTNLTYEEALVSEQRATEKVQQFPKELMAPVLHMVQFSSLTLKDLVNTISARLQYHLLEGSELCGKKEQSVCPCKILKILEMDGENSRYEVGWLDKNKEVSDTSIVNADELMRKRLPFSRALLKSFIRESTSRSAPWVVHDKLVRKHGVLTEPPEEFRSKLSIQNGCLSTMVKCRKNKEGREHTLDAENGKISKKRKKLENEKSEDLEMMKQMTKKEEATIEEPIKYPIDDLLVKPGADDPVFMDRPLPTENFIVPMDCVGDLLMVWDFCSSFSRLLNLLPFSLEDFENAICHKDSNLTLIVESHLAILRLLIKDEGKYFMAIQRKRQKSKMTKINWTEYLCDFLEMEDIPELSCHISTIKRGHYPLLDAQAKIGIFRELVAQALTADAIREQLGEFVEQQRALAATKREEELDEARKRKTEQKNLKVVDINTNEVTERRNLENRGGSLHNSERDYSHKKNVNVPKEGNEEMFPSNRNHVSENGETKHAAAALKKDETKQRMNGKATADNVESSRDKSKDKETQQKKSKGQRKVHIEREMEKRFIRTNPLGRDRNYNRYWFFRRDRRVFVESSDSKQWGYYTLKEELDSLMGSLNRKGERERALQRQLEKFYLRICSALQKRSKDIAHKIAMEEAVLRRSTRVRAHPKDSPATAFLRYVNKWKEG